MTSWDVQAKLEDLIDMLIDCHPEGFAVLLGEVQPPNGSEILKMTRAAARDENENVKKSTPDATTEAERAVWSEEAFATVVQKAYGWKHINNTCKGHREANLKLWDVVIDHARFVGTSPTRIGTQLGYVAIRHGIAPDTVTRYRREFPICLARAILCPPADGSDFRLMPG
ncbi:hypothetical protein AGMMS49957_17360 [Synergistales bacterium]|nr:hypothetical protein AGMMS49957_17360 [Synergistales bacterium]